MPNPVWQRSVVAWKQPPPGGPVPFNGPDGLIAVRWQAKSSAVKLRICGEDTFDPSWEVCSLPRAQVGAYLEVEDEDSDADAKTSFNTECSEIG